MPPTRTPRFQHSFPEPPSPGGQCSDVSMASSLAICLPTFSSDLSHLTEGQETQGHLNPSDPELATQALVSDPCQSLDSSSSQTTIQTGHPQTGFLDSSKPRLIPTDSLAFERQGLKRKGYSDRVLTTLLASSQSSTNRINSCTWKGFSF